MFLRSPQWYILYQKCTDIDITAKRDASPNSSRETVMLIIGVINEQHRDTVQSLSYWLIIDVLKLYVGSVICTGG